MCGRFVQSSDPEIYASQFDLDTLCEATPRYNVAPTQPVLAIRQSDEGKRALVRLRWGLVPAWSKGPDSRYSMINARAETVKSKPAYRNAFKHRRCLIPTEGFYEWKAGKDGKTPFLIRREGGELAYRLSSAYELALIPIEPLTHAGPIPEVTAGEIEIAPAGEQERAQEEKARLLLVNSVDNGLSEDQSKELDRIASEFLDRIKSES